MTSTAQFYDTNRKPPPPPGLPTLEQRAKAMQLEARNHKGNFSPKTEKVGLGHRAHQAVKMILPAKLSTKPASTGDIPKTILISATPEIHYENNFHRNFEARDEDRDSLCSYDDSYCSYTLAYEDSVFRNCDDKVEREQDFAAAGTLASIPVIERQRAFALSRSLESTDELDGEFPRTESVGQSPRPRFTRGLMKFFNPKKKKNDVKKGGSLKK